MNAEEREGSHQQAGHSPKSIKEGGISIRIAVCRMCQITPEPRVGSRVTLCAGSHKIFLAQLRSRISSQAGCCGPHGSHNTLPHSLSPAWKPSRGTCPDRFQPPLGDRFRTDSYYSSSEVRDVCALDVVGCVTVAATGQFRPAGGRLYSVFLARE